MWLLNFPKKENSQKQEPKEIQTSLMHCFFKDYQISRSIIRNIMKQKYLLMFFTCLVPVAFSILRDISHNYELIMTPQSWPNAQNYCRTMYTDLATVISDTDWLRLKKEAASKGLTSSAWIGVYDDITSWRWSLNDVRLKDLTYTNWYSGQPNNALSLEACVMLSSSAKWFDTSCLFLRVFICYNANFTGASKFIGINTLVTWYEARAYCRTYHTDLASSLNSSDQNMLAQIKAVQGDSWIGLYRDTWKWSDGTNNLTFAWAPGKPNNAAKIMGCCGSVTNGLLSDEPCTNLHYFFCHTIPPVRSYIKLQVKSDGSLEDSAVQSYILELMKQRLEQKGMLENTTVTWRLQPDGNIFYKKKQPLVASECSVLGV
ncbi:putative C-type lectin domain family 20 member A [Tachysurus fulvidraco]|uniref:putative C-type lectin domain family 20 member A n=1 Tax=Tachysurus fulvidraco TaxID=1234273 RepID=UPI001FEF9FDC|nr:putative C-type lectin domain family 20 member A [Tachysurus fulvidraco]